MHFYVTVLIVMLLFLMFQRNKYAIQIKTEKCITYAEKFTGPTESAAHNQ